MSKPVKGYTLPMNPMGMTPNMGEGDNQRAAGGPPLPGMTSNGPPNGANGGKMDRQGLPQTGIKVAVPVSHNTSPSLTSTSLRMVVSDTSDRVLVYHQRRQTCQDPKPSLLAKSNRGQPIPSNQMKSKRVTVSTFWMDITEVTRKDYKEFLEATGYRPPFIAEDWAEDGWNWNGVDYPEGTADHPVVMVSWYDAQEYCIWRGKRLPTGQSGQKCPWRCRLGNSFPWGKEYNHDNLNHGQVISNFDDSDGFLYIPCWSLLQWTVCLWLRRYIWKCLGVYSRRTACHMEVL